MSGDEQTTHATADRHLRSERALAAQLLRHKLRRIFFLPRGARRCPAGRFAQNAAGGHSVWIMLVWSCWERAGRRRRPQNVIHTRDQMESERRRSRWTPRQRRATSPTLRCSRMSALASEVVWCQGLGWDPKKVRYKTTGRWRVIIFRISLHSSSCAGDASGTGTECDVQRQ